MADGNGIKMIFDADEKCQSLGDFMSEIDKVFFSLRSEQLQFIEILTEDIREHLEIEKRFQKKLRERNIRE